MRYGQLKIRTVFLFCLIIILRGTGLSFSLNENVDWPALIKMIREEYPTVKQITTQQLAELLSTADKEKPLLLDARENAEYAVSHLQNALHAATAEGAVEVLKYIEKDHNIVVYCSVGYRSSKLARRLQAMGYTNVWNLEGSIFKWANEGRPLYKGGQLVHHAHPFNKEWGRFLDRRLWSDY